MQGWAVIRLNLSKHMLMVSSVQWHPISFSMKAGHPYIGQDCPPSCKFWHPPLSLVHRRPAISVLSLNLKHTNSPPSLGLCTLLFSTWNALLSHTNISHLLQAITEMPLSMSSLPMPYKLTSFPPDHSCSPHGTHHHLICFMFTCWFLYQFSPPNQNVSYTRVGIFFFFFGLSYSLLFSHSVVSDTWQLHGLQPAKLLCPQDFPGRNIRVGCHFLFQWIFLTQGSNPCLLYRQADSLLLSHQGSL